MLDLYSKTSIALLSYEATLLQWFLPIKANGFPGVQH